MKRRALKEASFLSTCDSDGYKELLRFASTFVCKATGASVAASVKFYDDVYREYALDELSTDAANPTPYFTGVGVNYLEPAGGVSRAGFRTDRRLRFQHHRDREQTRRSRRFLLLGPTPAGGTRRRIRVGARDRQQSRHDRGQRSHDDAIMRRSLSPWQFWRPSGARTHRPPVARSQRAVDRPSSALGHCSPSTPRAEPSRRRQRPPAAKVAGAHGVCAHQARPSFDLRSRPRIQNRVLPRSLRSEGTEVSSALHCSFTPNAPIESLRHELTPCSKIRTLGERQTSARVVQSGSFCEVLLVIDRRRRAIFLTNRGRRTPRARPTRRMVAPAWVQGPAWATAIALCESDARGASFDRTSPRQRRLSRLKTVFPQVRERRPRPAETR